MRPNWRWHPDFVDCIWFERRKCHELATDLVKYYPSAALYFIEDSPQLEDGFDCGALGYSSLHSMNSRGLVRANLMIRIVRPSRQSHNSLPEDSILEPINICTNNLSSCWRFNFWPMSTLGRSFGKSLKDGSRLKWFRPKIIGSSWCSRLPEIAWVGYFGSQSRVRTRWNCQSIMIQLCLWKTLFPLEELGCFTADPSKEGELFTIVIPLPNVWAPFTWDMH